MIILIVFLFLFRKWIKERERKRGGGKWRIKICRELRVDKARDRVASSDFHRRKKKSCEGERTTTYSAPEYFEYSEHEEDGEQDKRGGLSAKSFEKRRKIERTRWRNLKTDSVDRAIFWNLPVGNSKGEYRRDKLMKINRKEEESEKYANRIGRHYCEKISIQFFIPSYEITHGDNFWGKFSIKI